MLSASDHLVSPRFYSFELIQGISLSDKTHKNQRPYLLLSFSNTFKSTEIKGCKWSRVSQEHPLWTRTRLFFPLWTYSIQPRIVHEISNWGFRSPHKAGGVFGLWNISLLYYQIMLCSLCDILWEAIEAKEGLCRTNQFCIPLTPPLLSPPLLRSQPELWVTTRELEFLLPSLQPCSLHKSLNPLDHFLGVPVCFCLPHIPLVRRPLSLASKLALFYTKDGSAAVLSSVSYLIFPSSFLLTMKCLNFIVMICVNLTWHSHINSCFSTHWPLTTPPFLSF